MSKASKPKNQHKTKPPHQRTAQLPSPEALLAAAAAQEPAGVGTADVQEAALASAVTDETAPELTSKAAALQALRAAQLAKQQQSKQWKQQLKAGKMVGAQVPKRFNRGG